MDPHDPAGEVMQEDCKALSRITYETDTTNIVPTYPLMASQWKCRPSNALITSIEGQRPDSGDLRGLLDSVLWVPEHVKLPGEEAANRSMLQMRRKRLLLSLWMLLKR